MKDTGNNYYSLLSEREIELDYFIADKDSLSPSPLAGKLLESAAGKKCSVYYPDETKSYISWASGTGLCTLKIKADLGRCNIRDAEKSVYEQITIINKHLNKFNAFLLPSAVNPFTSVYYEVFKTYNSEIPENSSTEFECCSGVHFMNLILKFEDENQFYRLFSAVRLILPIIPALTSGSPLLRSRYNGILDNGLDLVKSNRDGRSGSNVRIIPESVKNRKEYESGSIAEIYKSEKSNMGNDNYNRTVTVDFERGRLSLKVFNMQESPHVDFALARFITYVLELLVNCRCGAHNQASVSTEELSNLLDEVIEKGLTAISYNEDYLKLLSINRQEKLSAWGIWMILSKKVRDYAGVKFPPVENILKTGSLSERILKQTDKKTVFEVYKDLACCLEENTMMLV